MRKGTRKGRGDGVAEGDLYIVGGIELSNDDWSKSWFHGEYGI